MYSIEENGKEILQIHSVFGIQEAEQILATLHACGRTTCNLWFNDICLAESNQQEKETCNS